MKSTGPHSPTSEGSRSDGSPKNTQIHKLCRALNQAEAGTELRGKCPSLLELLCPHIYIPRYVSDAEEWPADLSEWK